MAERYAEPYQNFEKKFAVITGASSGIGYELAIQFAKNGFDILVVAEDSGIFTAADAFREFGTMVHVVQADLTRPEEVEKTYAEIKTIKCPVHSICLNAGVGVGGASFDKTSWDAELYMLKLNVISTVHLAKLVLPDMVARGEGKILITSSIASIMPGPYEAVYAATKSFVQSFAQALHAENQDKGITVTALLPGPTETNFFHRAGMDDTVVGGQKKDDAAQVAKQGYEALMAGDDQVIGGSIKNKVQSAAVKVMSQPMAAKVHGSMSKPNNPQNR